MYFSSKHYLKSWFEKCRPVNPPSWRPWLTWWRGPAPRHISLLIWSWLEAGSLAYGAPCDWPACGQCPLELGNPEESLDLRKYLRNPTQKISPYTLAWNHMSRKRWKTDTDKNVHTMPMGRFLAILTQSTPFLNIHPPQILQCIHVYLCKMQSVFSNFSQSSEHLRLQKCSIL